MFTDGELITLKPKDVVKSIVKYHWPKFEPENQEYLESVLQLQGLVFEAKNIRLLDVPIFKGYYRVEIDHPLNNKYWFFADLFESCEPFASDTTTSLFGAT